VQAAPGRKTYQVLFLKQCKKIRRVRKEIAEIVERTSQHSSAGGAPSTMTSAGGHGQSDRVIHPDSGAGTGSLADAPGAEEEFGPGGGGGLPARQQLNVAAVVKRSQKRLMFKIANLLEEHRQELMRDLGQVRGARRELRKRHYGGLFISSSLLERTTATPAGHQRLKSK
jgi:hypothetical protein